MLAGQLDRFIKILVVTETQSATGDPLSTWSSYAEVWAKRTDLVANEGASQDQRAAVGRATFKIYYLDGVVRKMRIDDDGEIFDVVGIQMLGRREGLLLTGESEPA